MERANEECNPGYLRLADLAMAFAGYNGHAEFEHGELSKFLGKDYRAVDTAIERAMEYGLLAKGSHRRCLQIPTAQFVTYAGGGTLKEQEARRLEPCPTCRSGPRRPASCHPERERHTSVEAGALCDSCYRKRLRSATEHADPVDEYFADLRASELPAEDWETDSPDAGFPLGNRQC